MDLEKKILKKKYMNKLLLPRKTSQYLYNPHMYYICNVYKLLTNILVKYPWKYSKHFLKSNKYHACFHLVIQYYIRYYQ